MGDGGRNSLSRLLENKGINRAGLRFNGSMRDMEALRQKFTTLRPFLDERARRVWAATEAAALGYGGVSLVTSGSGRPVRLYQRAGRGVSGGGSAGNLGRHQEEGTGGSVCQPRARMATAWLPGTGQHSRLSRPGARQGHSVWGLRSGGERGVGECGGGSRYGGVRGGHDRAVVAAHGNA